MLNFFEGDPFVIGFESDVEVMIMGCTIINIDPKSGSLDLKIDKVDQKTRNAPLKGSHDLSAL